MYTSDFDVHLAAVMILTSHVKFASRHKMANCHRAFYILMHQEEGDIADPLLPNSGQFSIQLEDEICSNLEPPKRALHVPWFIVGITLVQIGSFVFTTRISGDNPYHSIFAFDPERIREAWTLLTYAVLHWDIQHLGGNLLLQILFGILEVTHGTLHAGIIYTAGVLGGKWETRSLKKN